MSSAPLRPLRLPAMAIVFALAALPAAAPAAAEDKSTKPRVAVIEFKNDAGDGWLSKLDVDSISWGETRPVARVSKVDSFTVKQKVIERDAGPGSNETITIGSNRTESTLPGKRTPPTVVLKRGTGASETGTPRQRGSVMLRLAQPWAGCAVGSRFDGAYLTVGATHRYQLHDGEIAHCGGDNVTINYTKFAAEGQPLR